MRKIVNIIKEKEIDNQDELNGRKVEENNLTFYGRPG
jgi:hypothetical protein